MAKLKNPLLGFDIKGSLSKAISFRGRGSQTIAEKKPTPQDTKSPSQLSWRHMYQKAAALWHLLSPEEKADWESGARTKHMTGFAWFMSQCLKPNPGIYLPLQGGTMQGDIDMADHKITDLPAPALDQEAATKKYVDDAAPAAGSKIADADGDTKVDVEEGPDEDKVRMDVKGVEAFLLDDAGILTLVKQSAARAHKEDSDQTISTSTVTKVVLETEDFDIQGEFDPVTNYRFTAKMAGLYLIIGQVRYSAAVDQEGYQCRIHKNGNELQTFQINASGTGSLIVSNLALVQLAVDDYLELYTRQGSGVDATLTSTYKNCWLSVAKIA